MNFIASCENIFASLAKYSVASAMITGGAYGICLMAPMIEMISTSGMI